MRIDVLRESVAQDEEGAVVVIRDPYGDAYTYTVDGTEKEVSVTIVGLQSKARQKAEDAAAKSIGLQGRAAFDPVNMRARRLSLAAACVIAWEGWEDENGTAIPFSNSNVKLVLGQDERVLAQVEDGIARHHAFLAKS